MIAPVESFYKQRLLWHKQAQASRPEQLFSSAAGLVCKPAGLLAALAAGPCHSNTAAVLKFSIDGLEPGPSHVRASVLCEYA
jgi:hypothetical protein